MNLSRRHTLQVRERTREGIFIVPGSGYMSGPDLVLLFGTVGVIVVPSKPPNLYLHRILGELDDDDDETQSSSPAANDGGSSRPVRQNGRIDALPRWNRNTDDSFEPDVLFSLLAERLLVFSQLLAPLERLL